MKKENIFIHIPKTGGTTINCVINKSEWQTTPDFHYRHIIYETKKSNTTDIFNPLNYDKFKQYNIFMLLRNPIDRIISEYYFIKDRPEFMNLLKPIPKNLTSYIKNKQTQNYMVGFLLGKRMYDEDIVNKEDLNLAVNTINSLNIKVGIFDYYKASLNYFSSITKIKIPKKIDVKRITLNRPKIEDVSEEIKELIIENNQLDFELYNIFKRKFEELNIPEKNINFNTNKYNYILKYTERFNLLEIGLKDKKFISNNQNYFLALNNHFHKKIKITNGEDYVASWNASFLKSIYSQFPNSTLTKKLAEINIDNHLEKTERICKVLNTILSSKEGKQYQKKLSFNASDVKLIQQKGIFSKIFSKIFN